MERHAIFPLNLFLLPGEVTHLHIFEPRYKQLLKDVEEEGIPFGIYYQGTENRLNLGTMVELVQVINKYSGGELDISVRATYMFKLEWFFDKLNDKLYPGGEVAWNPIEDRVVSVEVLEEYKNLMSIKYPDDITELPNMTFELATSLNLISKEKLELVQMSPVNQDKILLSHIRLQTAIIKQDKNNQFNFNWN